MRKLLRIAAFSLLVLIGLPIALYLLLVLVNLGDDELAPEVQALLTARPSEVPVEQNGYLAWIGVLGHPQQDPHAWGRRWLAEVLEKPASGPDAKYPIVDEFAKPAVDSKDIPCSTIDTCFDAVAADPAKAQAVLDQSRPMLDRIEQAMAYPAYQELWRPSDPSAPLPRHPVQWRSLSATRFALAAGAGRHDEAISQLEREVAFIRRQLAGSTQLIGKLVAVANLRTRYQLLSEYLRRDPEAALARGQRLAALLAPLPREAVDFGPVMAAEERQMALGFQAAMRGQPADFMSFSVAVPPALLWPLIRSNQTINEASQSFAIWRTIDARQGADYRRALADAGAALDAAAEAAAGWDSLRWRNPVGHLLVVLGAPNFRNYFRRRDDILALRLLVDLQLDLLRRGIAKAEQIAPEVAARAADLQHAFYGQPPLWDAAKRTLAYPQPTAPDGTPQTTEKPVQVML